MSNGVADGFLDSPPEHVANGYANGKANGHSVQLSVEKMEVRRLEKAKAPTPVDWEIPRKILHSSIGTLGAVLYPSSY